MMILVAKEIAKLDLNTISIKAKTKNNNIYIKLIFFNNNYKNFKININKMIIKIKSLLFLKSQLNKIKILNNSKVLIRNKNKINNSSS